ncbi:YbaB/EbfC family nucleoid-associated protein [Actinokineospora sp. 24-640]
MSSPHSDPDRMLAGFQAQIEANLRQADQLQAATEGLRVTESSPDSSVSVTVDATGNVADLKLTTAALAKGPDAVATSVLTTLRAAQARVGERVRETVAPLLGENSATMDMLMSGYADRFGAAEPTPPAPPTRRPRGDDDDDYGQTDSWLRS